MTSFDPNWADLYEALAADSPDHLVLINGPVRLTWREFDAAAARAATFFAGLGVGPGDRIAVYAYNRAEYLVANYAAMKLRAAVININFRYSAAEVDYHLKDSGARVLLYSEALGPTVAALNRSALVRIAIETLREQTEGLAPHPSLERSGDDEFMLYTGGTTGMPKGVVWNHAALFRAMWGSAASAGMGAPGSAADVCLAARRMRESGDAPTLVSCPPLIHGMGVFQAMSAMVRGGAVVLLSSQTFDPAEVWDTVEREHVTDLSIVGDAFARPLVTELERRESMGSPVDLSKLRVITSSGMGWSAANKREFRKRGTMVLLDMLGASEGGPLGINRNEPGMPIEDVSQFTIGPNALLLDESLQVIEPGSGRSGVLGFRGSGSIRYHGDEQKTAEVFKEIDGELYVIAGDYATVDSDGTLTFLGRGSGCINSGGEKIYPAEVEDALKEHPQVIDAVVVGIPDPSFGEVVAAVIETAGDLSDGELKEHLANRIARYKAPRTYVRVDALQHHASGKIDYSWIRRQLDALDT